MSGTNPTAPATAANPILSPPRLSGDPAQDNRAMQRWMQDLYDQLVKVYNVVGTQQDLLARVTTLEGQVAVINTHLGL